MKLRSVRPRSFTPGSLSAAADENSRSRWTAPVPGNRIGRALIACSLSLPFMVACGGGRDKQKPPKETVPVRVALVAEKPMPVEIRVVGHVESMSSIAIRPRVGGEIRKIHFREGQNVAEGDLLVTIDPRPYEAAENQAKARLERDRALAKNADDEWKRYADLVKKDYVTQQQYDQARTHAAAAAATIHADEADLESAKLQLEYCSVRAPQSGRAGGLLVQAGNIIKANDDKPILVINRISPIHVSFSIPERHLGGIEKGMRSKPLAVRAAPSGEKKDQVAGELTFVDNSVDRLTGTILLKAIFANRDRALWPGEFVDVDLVLETESKAIVVPSAAVLTGQKGPYVFVMTGNGTVESRAVVVDRTLDQETVVSRGVAAGESVVVDGQLRLTPGAAVEVKSAAEAASARP